MDADPWEIVDDTEPPDAEFAAPAEEPISLDTRRIERIATLHRSGLRARSWQYIVVLFCWVASVEFAILAQQHWYLFHQYVWGLAETALCVCLFALGTWRFLRRDRIGPTSTNSAVLPPPDFEPLGDGSQRWRNCEQIR